MVSTRFTVLTAMRLISVILVLWPSAVFSQPVESFDIYIVEVKSGEIRQLTSTPGAGEFNPCFSHDGKSVVHDVVTFFPFSHDLFVTDVASGVSQPLQGGEGGNDAVWSPNGQFIAFDRAPVGDPSIYIVPATGGQRTLIRARAVDPHWSPNSRRLVFTDVTDGSVRTLELRGGKETIIAAFGLNPAWSPNGNYIAFGDGNNLFEVAVDPAGNVTGAPTQVTSDGGLVFNQQPSWANNSQTIAFHSNRGGSDFALFTIDIRGNISLLADLPGASDLDPSYFRNGKWVAYSGVSP